MAVIEVEVDAWMLDSDEIKEVLKERGEGLYGVLDQIYRLLLIGDRAGVDELLLSELQKNGYSIHAIKH